MRRTRPALFLLAFSLGALLVLGLLLIPIPGMGRPVLREIQDAGHIAVFAVLAVFLRTWLGSTPLAFILAVGAGFGTEVLQALGPRDASWGDVRRDAAGALAGLLLFVAWQRRAARQPWFAAALALGAFVTVGIALRPVWTQLAAQLEARREWPVLLGTSTPLAPLNSNWRLANLEYHPLGYRLTFDGEPWPGITWEGWMSDWSSRTAWVVDIENLSEEPVQIGLVVRDASDDGQFDFSADFGPRQRRTLRLPLSQVALTPGGRRLDLSDVRSYTVLRTGGTGKEVLIREIRLE